MGERVITMVSAWIWEGGSTGLPNWSTYSVTTFGVAVAAGVSAGVVGLVQAEASALAAPATTSTNPAAVARAALRSMGRSPLKVGMALACLPPPQGVLKQ